LTGAQLQAADFSSASVQAASLSYANLQGAILRDADFSTATFNNVRLEGADLTGAKVTGADFRHAGIWLTKPPLADADGLADMSELSMRPLTDSDVAAMKQGIERVRSRRVRAELTERLAPIMNIPESANWIATPEAQQWQSFQAASAAFQPETYKYQLTEYLAKLQCKMRWSSGSVATGVARRAQGPQFRGDLAVIYDRLDAAECPASKSVPAKVLRDLGAAADAAGGN
jgi:hypothetical protein